jgi:hypothetical protein
MERIWAAEIAVDKTLAARLIEAQCPALSPVTAEALGAGLASSVDVGDDGLAAEASMALSFITEQR